MKFWGAAKVICITSKTDGACAPDPHLVQESSVAVNRDTNKVGNIQTVGHCRVNQLKEAEKKEGQGFSRACFCD